MRRPALVYIALVAGGVAAGGGLTWATTASGWGDFAFASLLITLLGFTLFIGGRSWLEARNERRRMLRLVQIQPEAVGRDAVREERIRLAADIEACLREALQRIAAELDLLASEPDPRRGLSRIHHHARWAASELRRQLGLLRGSDEERPGPLALPDVPVEPRRGLSRRDLWLSGLMVTDVLVESFIDRSTNSAWSVWSVVLTAFAAACVVGRSLAPAAAATACALLFGLGTALGAPVMGGLMLIGTVCVLLWTAAALTVRSTALVAGATFLFVSVGVTRLLDDPGNFPITMVLMSVAVLVGLITGRGRRRRRAAADRSARHEQQVREAVEAALWTERTMFARELHDVVSHAVGVIAMQAAAAQVSWPSAPETVSSSIRLIRSTTDQTLAEFNKMLPGARSAAHSVSDVEALADRIRATGMRVQLVIFGEPDNEATTVAYRIIQETLTNAVRHASGSNVSVRLEAAADRTMVEVTDDGPGAGAQTDRGYGLIGLAERVAIAGGTLDIGPGSNGRGFRVAVVLPQKAEAAPQ